MVLINETFKFLFALVFLVLRPTLTMKALRKRNYYLLVLNGEIYLAVQHIGLIVLWQLSVVKYLI